MGNGVVASNITYNGSAVNAQSIQGNVSYFDATSTTFPLARGVILTTGNGVAAIGPNTSGSFTNNSPATPNVSGDADLNAIANGSVTNGAILEFDFVPSGDTVSFRYVFGSDEYPEFSPSSFNDAFGFFLSGPGLSGPYTNGAVNIALIPGTSTPVTINNVGDASNTQYYVDNLGGAGYGTAIQYDGTTVIFTAVSEVQCGQTYHIKLAISNVGDQSYDSGVFLEADSFSSEAVDISVATVGGDTTVIEGCTDATFYFTRPITQVDDSLVVSYGISGDAIMGVDFNNLPNPVIFVPGEDSIVLTLLPVQDGIDETPEYVTLTATTVTECGDTIVSTGTLWIIDGPDLPINESDVTIYCPNDSVPVTATASGGFGPYTITWSYAGQTGTSAFVPGTANGAYDYYVFATDACGNTGADTVTVTVNQTLAIDTMNATPTASCQNTGIVWGLGEGITGVPQYHWEGPGQGGPIDIDGTAMQNLPSGWYIFSIEDDVCNVMDSIFVDIEEPPVASFTLSTNSGCSPLSVTITNTSQNATNYAWNFGNGNTLNTTNMSTPIDQTYANDGIITLIASKGPCADTMQAAITISICGCTSPDAINYNPLATVDDGSCVFPDPTVEVPNVFTPNGDNVNDVFQLKTTYAVKVEIKIMDRWGIVMYEGTDAKAVWDGEGATEGVYFYTYTVTGMVGNELTGHGFVQLFR
jgi:gliding motility-associated-like protein